MSLATAPAQGTTPIPALAEPSAPGHGTANDTEPKLMPQLNEKRQGGELAAKTVPKAAEGEEKKKKRSLFGFGKKKTEEPAKPTKSDSTSKPAPTTSRSTTASPIQTDHAHFSPSSPGRAGFASSPRLASPAGSQIFERDVQESAASLMPNSPAIPSHIQTENYIPPVLDASSSAITDNHLDPDTVEIITHTSHQPASVAVGAGLSPTSHHAAAETASPSWADELAAFSAAKRSPTAGVVGGDTASNYGSFDTTDVRRLSFISFADVVQAEQQQFPGGPAGSRDSMHLAGLTSLPTSAAGRSPSPIRSPVSSAGGGYGYSSGYGHGGRGSSASPPTSKSGSVKGVEVAVGQSSPGRKPLGSPTSMLSMQLGSQGAGSGSGPTVNGEIAIETMREALRRTGSGDLGQGQAGNRVGSFPASPI